MPKKTKPEEPKLPTREEWEDKVDVSFDPAEGTDDWITGTPHGMVAVKKSCKDDFGKQKVAEGTVGYYDDDDYISERGEEVCTAVVYFGVPFASPAFGIPHNYLRPASPAEIAKWRAKVYNDATFHKAQKGSDSPPPIQGDPLN